MIYSSMLSLQKFISEGTIDRVIFIATKEVPCCKMITLSLVQTVVSEKSFIAFQPLEKDLIVIECLVIGFVLM